MICGIQLILKFSFQKKKLKYFETSEKILHFPSQKMISLTKEFFKEMIALKKELKINKFNISKNYIICAKAAKVTMVVNSLLAQPIL